LGKILLLKERKKGIRLMVNFLGERKGPTNGEGAALIIRFWDEEPFLAKYRL